jgi:hypothetical protein
MKTIHLVKSFIFPVLIVSIGLLYLAGPSKIQVVNLMHTISNSVWTVTFVEVENHSHENDGAAHHEHNFLEPDTILEKVHYHEKKESNVHSHGLHSFSSTVFDSSENKGEKQQRILEVKLDKHILPENTTEEISLPIVEAMNTFFHADKDYKLGLDVKIPPPKVDLT